MFAFALGNVSLERREDVCVLVVWWAQSLWRLLLRALRKKESKLEKKRSLLLQKSKNVPRNKQETNEKYFFWRKYNVRLTLYIKVQVRIIFMSILWQHHTIINTEYYGGKQFDNLPLRLYWKLCPHIQVEKYSAFLTDRK